MVKRDTLYLCMLVSGCSPFSAAYRLHSGCEALGGAVLSRGCLPSGHQGAGPGCAQGCRAVCVLQWRFGEGRHLVQGWDVDSMEHRRYVFMYMHTYCTHTCYCTYIRTYMIVCIMYVLFMYQSIIVCVRFRMSPDTSVECCISELK